MSGDQANPAPLEELAAEKAPTTSKISFLTIGFKIYSIVGLCLFLLAGVGGIAIWQMDKIGAELEAIAEQDIPLSNALSKVTIHQLEQAVYFERALRLGHEMTTHPEIRKDFPSL